MGDFTKLSINEAGRILKCYGIEEEFQLFPMTHGISNSNYHVQSAKGDLVLKVSNDKGTAEMNEELKILNHLKDKGFEYCLRPLRTMDQKLIYEVDDLHGCLFPFIKGEPPALNQVNLKKIGEALAKLHLLQPSSRLRNHNDVGYGIKRIKDYASDFKSQALYLDYLKQILGEPQEFFTKLMMVNFPMGVIHGDLYYDNSLFNESGELLTLLDFEQAGLGPYIFDIGISISGSCLNPATNKISPFYIKSFLEGYESVRTLDDIERQFLDDFILAGLFSISLWRIKRFTEGNLDKTKKESYIELLERAQDFQNNVRS